MSFLLQLDDCFATSEASKLPLIILAWGWKIGVNESRRQPLPKVQALQTAHINGLKGRQLDICLLHKKVLDPAEDRSS
jgi:hypothetical protein